MTPGDFVYMQIYKGSLSSGAVERIAKEQAQIGTENYRKNNFQGKVSALITSRIKEAVKLSKAYK